MIIDRLGLLRADGTGTGVEATEAGSVSLIRDAASGRAVLDIRKTALKGLPVVVITRRITTGDRSFVVTIEAADELAFTATREVVATFPAVVASSAETLMVRRVHTQRRFLRSVITLGVGTTGRTDFLIFVGHELMNT